MCTVYYSISDITICVFEIVFPVNLTVIHLQVNAGGIGFYRTVYPQNMLDALIPAIKNQTMPPRDRLGLQNDLFALVVKVTSSVLFVVGFDIISYIAVTFASTYLRRDSQAV